MKLWDFRSVVKLPLILIPEHFCPQHISIQKATALSLRHLPAVNIHVSNKTRNTTMPPRKMAQESLISSAVKAEDISPHSCADFRCKWTPTEFCNLPLSERTVILLGLLTSSDPIFIVQVDGGYKFATENTLIHDAMPLLYDFSTNKQIAREACDMFYQVRTVLSGVSFNRTLTNPFAAQHVRSILSLASSHGSRSDKHLDNA